mgnify:CR=1 FL=1
MERKTHFADDEETIQRGLVFDIVCPYFACFRKPTSTSVILTYPIPPFTTLCGLVACALGRPRNDFVLQNALHFGIRILAPGIETREMAKVLKLTGEEKEVEQRVSASSPMYRHFLAQPVYRIYLLANSELLDEVIQALREPLRPLYLGQSDDMVVVENVIEYTIRRGYTNTIYSIVAGIFADCSLLKLPRRFSDEDTLIYSPVLSLPPELPWTLERKIEAYFFGEEAIWIAD